MVGIFDVSPKNDRASSHVKTPVVGADPGTTTLRAGSTVLEGRAVFQTLRTIHLALHALQSTFCLVALGLIILVLWHDPGRVFTQAARHEIF